MENSSQEIKPADTATPADLKALFPLYHKSLTLGQAGILLFIAGGLLLTALVITAMLSWNKINNVYSLFSIACSLASLASIIYFLLWGRSSKYARATILGVGIASLVYCLLIINTSIIYIMIALIFATALLYGASSASLFGPMRFSHLQAKAIYKHDQYSPPEPSKSPLPQKIEVSMVIIIVLDCILTLVLNLMGTV